MATFDAARFDEAMKQAPEALFKHLLKALDDWSRSFATNTMARQAKRAFRTSKPGGIAGSFKSNTFGKSLNDLRSLVFTTNKYARIQEFGGTIVPKNRQYLSIPLSGAMQGPRAQRRARGSARSFGYEKTFVQEVGGKPYVFIKTGKRRPAGWTPGQRDPSIQPLFALVKQVQLDPRLGFFATWEREKPAFTKQVMKAVDAALDGLGK